jgi:hypothetical protein
MFTKKSPLFICAAILCILVGIGIFATSSVYADADLKFQWRFNEGAGIIASDSSGNTPSYPGTLYNGPTWIPGGGISLDGINDYARTDNPIPGSMGVPDQAYTLSASVRVAEGEEDGNIIHISNGEDGIGWCISMLHIRDGYFRAIGWENSFPVIATAPEPAVAGEWYSIANTWSPETNSLDLYVNGVLVASSTMSSYDAANEDVYVFAGIGTGMCSNDQGFFEGDVKDVRIYSRAITEEEAQENSNEVLLGAPYIDSLSPANNATGVSTTANLVMTFSAEVTPATGTINIYRAGDDSLFESIIVTSSQVIGSDTNTIMIDPIGVLDELTEYYVLVSSTAFINTSGTPYAGISNTTTWRFTTADETTLAPTILSPSSDFGVLATNDDLTVEFIIPEMPLAGSVQLMFLPDDEEQDPIILTLSDPSPTVTTTLEIDFSEPLVSILGVQGANTSSIPHGVYSIVLSYQDVLGNPAATTVIEPFFVAYLPVLETLEVTEISQTSATFNAIVTDGLISGQLGVDVLFGFFVDQQENSYLNSEFIPGPVEPEEYGPFSLVFSDFNEFYGLLDCGTTYYVQALGLLPGEGFSLEYLSVSENSVSFTTLACEDEEDEEDEDEEKPRRRSGGVLLSVSAPRITNNTTATTGALSINNGAVSTNSRTVELTINATNATQMAISNSVLFSSDISYVPFSSSVTHVLSPGVGEKTVFIKLLSSDGGVLMIRDSIVLEPELAPVLPQGIVEPTTPIPANGLQCTTTLVLSTPVRLGATNNPNDVKLLKQFLNTYENANLVVNGIYEQADFNAVVLWQEKHAADILTPWGLTRGTGYVFTTSLAKIKSIHEANCATAVLAPTAPVVPAAPTACLNTTDTLRVGMNNSSVATAQGLLKKLGHYPSNIDTTGYYGAVTETATRSFQTTHGISPVGFIGPQTRARLNQLGC